MTPATSPPLALIRGTEQVLAERALAQLLAQWREMDPSIEVVRLDAATYVGGDLTREASPSLFGGNKILVLADMDEAGDEYLRDVEAFLADLPADVRAVVLHKGGNRAKKVTDLLKAAKARVFEAAPLKTDRAKTDFAMNEFRAARRSVTNDAVSALVAAVGRESGELAAACQQLVADTTGRIDEKTVLTYYAGKVEATGFKVADAALAGDSGEALRMLRHALDVGVDPVPIVAVLAQQVRHLIKVGSAGRGRSVDLARDLGMAPWQVDKARRTLGGWTAEALARSLQDIAAADFDVKGGARDPVFALERTIVTMASLKSSER